MFVLERINCIYSISCLSDLFSGLDGGVPVPGGVQGTLGCSAQCSGQGNRVGI